MSEETTTIQPPEMVEMTEEEARYIAELLDKLIDAAKESIERLDRIHALMEETVIVWREAREGHGGRGETHVVS
jgi:K+/H+ antiporter YhaU regulatory subunit KhtT